MELFCQDLLQSFNIWTLYKRLQFLVQKFENCIWQKNKTFIYSDASFLSAHQFITTPADSLRKKSSFSILCEILMHSFFLFTFAIVSHFFGRNFHKLQLHNWQLINCILIKHTAATKSQSICFLFQLERFFSFAALSRALITVDAGLLILVEFDANINCRWFLFPQHAAGSEDFLAAIRTETILMKCRELRGKCYVNSNLVAK